MAKYTVTFKFECDDYLIHDEREFYENVGSGIEDLLNKAILPTLNLSLVPFTFEVKRARQ